MDSPEFRDECLDVQGKIYGQAPVQAEGSVFGQAFYFRARSGAWTFVIAPPLESVWDCFGPGESAGLFRSDKGWGYRSGDAWGHDNVSASAMGRDDVIRLILQETTAFLDALASVVTDAASGRPQ